MTTREKRTEHFLERHPLVILVPITILTYYLLAYLINPYVSLWHGLSTYDIGVQILGSSAFCFVILLGSMRITRRLNVRIPWSDRPLLRAIVQFFMQLLLAGVWIMIFQFLMAFLFYQMSLPEFFASAKFDTDQQFAIWRLTYSSILLSLVVSFVLATRTFREETDALKVHAAQLQQIAMQAELQSLKLQLDPHFVFNNFSTLSGLISEDPNLAQAFVENLARVYRYMIMNIHSDTVPLQKELRFIQSYVYLIKIRHGNNVKVTIDVPDEYLFKNIPPITLQLLIENAIKHNIASEAHPMNIVISARGDALEVSNTLQELASPPQTSSGIGLENIKSRYRIVFGTEPVVSKTAERFTVSLPLRD